MKAAEFIAKDEKPMSPPSDGESTSSVKTIVIEKIDPDDPEYQQFKASLPKDQPHFDHLKVFEDIIKARQDREELEKYFQIENEQLDDMVLHMKIANGELMDIEEEQWHLNKIKKERGLIVEEEDKNKKRKGTIKGRKTIK